MHKMISIAIAAIIAILIVVFVVSVSNRKTEAEKTAEAISKIKIHVTDKKR